MKLNTVYLFVILITLNMGCTSKPTEQRRPNILFAISDDQTFQHTGFAGCNFVNTPAFDMVASEGIYFSNCYASSPGCAPSRSSIVTGRHHWQNEQSGQHASSWMKKHVPFIDLLEKNGYTTGLTGKGVAPFQYARNEKDSLWRKDNAAGKSYSKIAYNAKNDTRFAKGIKNLNYFENFKYFIDNVRGNKPFFFWYGASEPHRAYEKGSWKRMGKKLEDVKVPEFLPDNDEIRGDLLDYAVEIEWFDHHLGLMLNYLEEINELDNTIVIVTADNGMPFPRAKANCFEYGVHVPFAIRYPKEFPGKRIVKDLVSFVDIAPTILELTKTQSENMLPISGKSFLKILRSKKQGIIDKNKEFVVAGRERHSSSRYLNWGYPQRVIRSEDFIYIWNIKSKRWPAGAPQRINPEDSTALWPMYGINEKGKYMSNGAFTDIDDCPSKTYIIENHEDPEVAEYFKLAHGKRAEIELYHVTDDPYCLNNLAGISKYAPIEKNLKNKLMAELQRSKDPRVVGPDKEVFDSYIRYSPMRDFSKPEYVKQ
ncbi:sulfatase [Tamlana sp. 2201CG12-4]|uniref:sulfatase family protein n=1 Tax=Tamlana sp. 2201CG12-4 TaxID=3112582 RepID=UPI002DB6D246|nr:sulfatase [Tamlana sp. 2201CG12-4]MEC3907025.1 sulfatase [Tamlana sp. 2201CG12-4]